MKELVFLLIFCLVISCNEYKSCRNQKSEKINFTKHDLKQLDSIANFIGSNIDTLYNFGCQKSSGCKNDSLNITNSVYLNTGQIERFISTKKISCWNQLTSISSKNRKMSLFELNFSKDKVLSFGSIKFQKKCDTIIEHKLLYVPKNITLGKRGYYVEHSYSEKLNDNWIYIITKCVFDKSGDNCDYIKEK